MGCAPTLAVVLVVAVLETSDEVTALVVVVVVEHCCRAENIYREMKNQTVLQNMSC